MTGRYTVTLTSQDQAPPHHHEPSVVPGRIYGVFAGITDYTARGQTNLQYCAQDAQRAHDAAVNGLGMSPGDAVLLLDDHATVRAFEDAITSLGPRLSHDDVLIVFYSGHGGQVERTTFQPADPDMLDEILVLADDDLTDDRLDELLRVVNAGTVLIVLDACNSGGFAKDVISAPGRMGLFASAEDCLSIVATEREAGGYLSDFFIEAIGHGRHQADTNGDGLLTVIELCQFIAERYRTEVTSDSKPPVTPRLYERTISPTQYRGYQLLHIDRGSIGPHGSSSAGENTGHDVNGDGDDDGGVGDSRVSTAVGAGPSRRASLSADSPLNPQQPQPPSTLYRTMHRTAETPSRHVIFFPSSYVRPA